MFLDINRCREPFPLLFSGSSPRGKSTRTWVQSVRGFFFRKWIFLEFFLCLLLPC
ncbi:hypothetical protein QQP08_018159 [Theobroma cacao]|nr:hypothetical protein QQP08_018159 [Theobroma cacao]